MKRFAIIVGLALASLSLGACGYAESTNTQVAAAIEQSRDQLEAQVGQPRITNYTEAKTVNWLYELRDQPGLQTFTYRSDMNGGLHCLGRSIGYGYSAATQRTNPQAFALRPMAINPITAADYDNILPQPEPNGLFMPDQTDGTWIIMVDPRTGKPTAIYSEDDVTVSPFPLANVIEQCK